MSVSSPSEVDNCQNWELVSITAREEYKRLQESIAKLVSDSGKAKFCKIFSDISVLIENYIAGDTTGTNERALICGYFYIGKLLAINTRQLMSLMGKCKSSINSGFQSIGYKVIPMDAESAVTLMKTFPFLKNQIGLTRQWTLRTKDPSQPIETNMKELLTKAISDAPIISVFPNSFGVKPMNEPSSVPSSAYTTPTPAEQKADIQEDEYLFDPQPSSNDDLFGDLDFFSNVDNASYFDSPDNYDGF